MRGSLAATYEINPDGTRSLIVLCADPVIAISDQVLAAELIPEVARGEGWFVLSAANGVFRYRLTERLMDECAWVAELRSTTPRP
jgi:hypothetical protein